MPQIAVARLKPHSRQSLMPPLMKAEFESLRADIARRGIQVPLCVTTRNVVLCGHHRLRAARELGIATVPATILREMSKAEEIAHLVLDNVQRRQLSASQKAAILTKPTVANALLYVLKEEARARQRAAGGRRDDSARRENRALEAGLPHARAPQTRDVLGRAGGVSGRTVGDAIYAWKRAPDRMRAVLAGTSDETVGRLALELRREEKATHAQAAIRQGVQDFEAIFGKVQRFDVWSFWESTPGFGTNWPGRIPAQIVANAIYYLTKPGDLVVDPCAGGGVTGDVCRALGRRSVSGDVQPSRPEILNHRIERGPLPGTKGKAQLVFVDPPYGALVAEQYSSASASALPWDPWTAWLDAMAKSCAEMLKPGGYVAILMQDDFKEIGAFQHDRSSVIAVISALQAASLESVTMIGVPKTTKPKGSDFEWAQKNRRVLGVNRQMVVFRRPPASPAQGHGGDARDRSTSAGSRSRGGAPAGSRIVARCSSTRTRRRSRRGQASPT